MAGLTDAKIQALKPKHAPYKRAVGRGLSILVNTSGGKLWRFRWRSNGKERMLSLGTFPDTDLETACALRDDVRKVIARGGDPSAQRRAEKLATGNTFEAVGRECIALQQPRLAPVTFQRAVWTLETLAYPYIGSRPIAAIKPADVLAVLRRIEAKGNHETARRACQRISQVFRYAVATGRAERDVTTDLRGALAPVVTEHHASITDPARIGDLLRAIDNYSGHGVTRFALQLAPLLFVRPGELRHAEWAEFNLDGPEPQWLIPGPKMKMRVAHIVPLATQSVALLRELYLLTGPSKSRKVARYCFPALTTPNRPMSENTENTALRRLGYSKEEMTAHGFRSLASTRLNEGFNGHRWNREWIERQLAHAERNTVTAAYNYAEYLPERRAMMQAWANYLDSLRAQPAKAAA